jgi:hypothetical protein
VPPITVNILHLQKISRKTGVVSAFQDAELLDDEVPFPEAPGLLTGGLLGLGFRVTQRIVQQSVVRSRTVGRVFLGSERLPRAGIHLLHR